MPKWLMILVAATCLVVLAGAGLWAYNVYQRKIIAENMAAREINETLYNNICSDEHKTGDTGSETGITDERWNLAKTLRAKYSPPITCADWNEFDYIIQKYKNHRKYWADIQYSSLCVINIEHKIDKSLRPLTTQEYEHAKKLHAEFPALTCEGKSGNIIEDPQLSSSAATMKP